MHSASGPVAPANLCSPGASAMRPAARLLFCTALLIGRAAAVLSAVGRFARPVLRGFGPRDACRDAEESDRIREQSKERGQEQERCRRNEPVRLQEQGPQEEVRGHQQERRRQPEVVRGLRDLEQLGFSSGHEKAVNRLHPGRRRRLPGGDVPMQTSLSDIWEKHSPGETVPIKPRWSYPGPDPRGMLRIAETNAEAMVTDFGMMPSGRGIMPRLMDTRREGAWYRPWMLDMEFWYGRAGGGGRFGKYISYDGRIEERLDGKPMVSMRVEGDVLTVKTEDDVLHKAAIVPDEELVDPTDRAYMRWDPTVFTEHFRLECLRQGLPAETIRDMGKAPNSFRSMDPGHPSSRAWFDAARTIGVEPRWNRAASGSGLYSCADARSDRWMTVPRGTGCLRRIRPRQPLRDVDDDLDLVGLDRHTETAVTVLDADIEYPNTSYRGGSRVSRRSKFRLTRNSPLLRRTLHPVSVDNCWAASRRYRVLPTGPIRLLSRRC